MWRHDLVRKLERCSREQEVVALLAECYRELGFGFVRLITVPLGEFAPPPLASLGDLPPKWLETFANNPLGRFDPAPRRALSSGHPIRWLPLTEDPSLTHNEASFAALFKASSMTDGLTLPVYGRASSSGIVMLGEVARPSLIDDSDLAWLHVAAESAFRRIEQLRYEASRDALLSAREQEVLYWIASGKSNADVATIVGISPATVATYVMRLFAKLGVNSRVAAALSATRLGLI